jgi:hypothetical protein
MVLTEKTKEIFACVGASALLPFHNFALLFLHQLPSHAMDNFLAFSYGERSFIRLIRLLDIDIFDIPGDSTNRVLRMGKYNPRVDRVPVPCEMAISNISLYAQKSSFVSS